MIQDFRFAARQLLKSPGFTSVAVITLALAIGANTAIFGLINAVLLRSPARLRPAEVVSIFNCRQNANHDYRQFSYNEYREIRDNGGELFADVAAFDFAIAGVGRNQDVRRSIAFLTSENYFALMGVQPFRGRFYNADETRPNANVPVVVVSYGFWKRMGGSNDFVGSTIYVNARPCTVIGIAPEGFGPTTIISPDLWLPLGLRSSIASVGGGFDTMRDLTNPKNYCLNMSGRLRSGLTLEAGRSHLPVLTERFNALQPPDSEFKREVQIDKPRHIGVGTSPSDEGPLKVIGVLLMAMSGAVLLIACLNLANMLLARGTARSKEIALRLALGASRWRIIRQLLCEGLLLAVAGGVVGLVISVWCNNVILRSLTSLLSTLNFSLIVDVAPDAVLLSITFLFCLAATLFFSLGPALKATRADLVNDLKQQVGEPARVGRISRFFALRHISVMAQIALSLMLLFAAGLFFRGAIKAGKVNPGFVAAGDLVTEMDYNLLQKEPAQVRHEIRDLMARLRDLPGVQAIGAGTMLPYSDLTDTRRVASSQTVLSNDPKAPDPGMNALYTAITPGYFDALGVRVLQGREFTPAECDDKDGHRVAMIDEELANKLFPNQSAIGQHLRYTVPPKDGSPNDMEIVGLVSTHRHDILSDTPVARVFVPLAQGYSGNVFLHLRLSRSDRASTVAMMPMVRETIRGVDPDAPVLNIAPFVDLMQKSDGLWLVRLGAILFGAFGAIALLLAIVGVYGVKAYAVACRTREIGIRMALGAKRGDVFGLIMRQGALQTALAVGVGTLLCLGAGRVLAQILYDVSPSDPIALAMASVLLAGAALLACFLPARRATRVNPLVALRTE